MTKPTGHKLQLPWDALLLIHQLAEITVPYTEMALHFLHFNGSFCKILGACGAVWGHSSHTFFRYFFENLRLLVPKPCWSIVAQNVCAQLGKIIRRCIVLRKVLLVVLAFRPWLLPAVCVQLYLCIYSLLLTSALQQTTSKLWCLRVKSEDYQNCSVLYCLLQLCAVVSILIWASELGPVDLLFVFS